MSQGYYFPEVQPAVVADTLPRWLEIEAQYANHKHGGKNPQRTALNGGLQLGGIAYQDFSNYYGRFLLFHEQAGGNEQLMIKASQALGKFVGVGRALLRVLVEDQSKLSIAEADQAVMQIVEDACVAPVELPEPDYVQFGESTLYPSLKQIADNIERSDLTKAASGAYELLGLQSRLFIAHVAYSGIMAEPGIGSTDEQGELGQWLVPLSAVVD